MKKLKILLIIAIFLLIPLVALAHSGRTDSNGGHYNRSTGEYHYHHGYPAHQHPNGVCPYETSTVNEDPPIETTSEDNTSINTRKFQEETYQNHIERLEDEISYKQDTIGELNKEINDYKQTIEEYKNKVNLLIFALVSIIVIMGGIICSISKSKKNGQ